VSATAVENVLAQRYASPEMVAIWSPENKIIAERRFWISVLRAQRAAGLDVGDDVLADYERVIEDVDLASIADRERVTRHDVKARIEEFNALAGHEQVHKGLTSRDLTENVEQGQIVRSLALIRDRTVAVLDRLGRSLGTGAGRPLPPLWPLIRHAGGVNRLVRRDVEAAYPECPGRPLRLGGAGSPVVARIQDHR
jgi:adenylosuccinate lyase